MKKLILLLLALVMSATMFGQAILITTKAYPHTPLVEMLLNVRSIEYVKMIYDREGHSHGTSEFLLKLSPQNNIRVPVLFMQGKTMNQVLDNEILDESIYDDAKLDFETHAIIDFVSIVDSVISMDGKLLLRIVYMYASAHQDIWMFLVKNHEVIQYFNNGSGAVSWNEENNLDDYRIVVFAHEGNQIVGVGNYSIGYGSFVDIKEMATETKLLYDYNNKILTASNVNGYLRIVDLQGRKWYANTVYNNDNLSLDLSNYESGYYFAQVIRNNSIVKVLKMPIY